MTEPIQLNEEIPQKYESYSNRANLDNLNTLNEPVSVTIVNEK